MAINNNNALRAALGQGAKELQDLKTKAREIADYLCAKDDAAGSALFRDAESAFASLQAALRPFKATIDGEDISIQSGGK